MFDAIDQIGRFLPVYLLVFGRVSAMTASMPILGYSTVNLRVRFLISISLTAIVAPGLTDTFTANYTSWLPLVLDMTREVFAGLMIGFGARLIFEGITIAGSYIGLQMGMAIMNVFDPSSQQQQPIISNFWLLIMVTVFLVTNSHYFLIATIFDNFRFIPLGAAAFHPAVGREFLHAGTQMYDIALKFAAPTLIFLLTVDVSIAFMARVMPQLNVFFISLPLKIGMGIFLLIVSLKIFQSLFGYIFMQLESFVTVIIRGL